MSIQAPSLLRRLLDPLWSVPDEDKGAVQDELASRNARHLRVLVPITVLLHGIGLWTGLRGPGPNATEATRSWLWVLSVLHASMFLPVLALFVALYLDHRRGGFPGRVRALAGEIFVLVYAVFGALVSANAQRARPNIDIFTIALLAGAFLATPARSAIPSALVAASILCTAIVHFGTDEAHVRSLLANTIAMAVAAAVFARLIYTSNVREIAARRVNERQREALTALNASLETKVAEKVGELVTQAKELERLNAQLEARVEERSRELSAALDQLARARPQALPPGLVLDDRVRIVRFLASGGMGAVYEATDLRTDDRVAVKVVKASFLDNPEEAQRFLREARAGARVVHPAVARTIHVDVSRDGQLYQVQELVEGVALSRALVGPIAPREAAALGALLAQALAVAHARGVVHRDVKPSNLMLTRAEPGLKVLDFGISKIAMEEREAPLTMSSHILGTPESMAPEQILTPHQITDRCDVYLTGLVLYRMMAGRGPYTAETSSQYLVAHAFDTPAPLELHCPSVKPALAALVHACLAKTPSERPSMAEVAVTLARESDGLVALDVARALLSRVPVRDAPTRSDPNDERVTLVARGTPSPPQ